MRFRAMLGVKRSTCGCGRCDGKHFAVELDSERLLIIGADGPLTCKMLEPAERFMHTFSTGIFVLLYLVMLWRMKRAPQKLRSLHGMVYWMAVVWIVYCAIGSPWFWPWYLVTFFGLFALLEASDAKTADENPREIFPWRLWLMRTPWAARLFSFSMLTLYCLITGPSRAFVHGLPGFQWSDFAGAWAWVLPLAGSALLMKYIPPKKPLRSDATVS